MKYCWLLFFVFVADGMPKSRNRNSYTTYDEKQTGDYNIRLHLKDFQIVAFMGDESLDTFGDYEYNYDYSELTVKPQNATSKPTTPQPTFTTPSTTTTTKRPPPSYFPTKISTSTSTVSPPSTYSKLPSSSSVTTATTTTTTIEPPSSTSSSEPKPLTNVTTTTTASIPGRIVVEIVTENVTVMRENGTKRNVEEEVVKNGENNDQVALGGAAQLGEVAHYRKCSAGYTRDKRGRCRKTRRPTNGLRYGLTRLASNIASQLRPTVMTSEDKGTSDEN